MIELLFGSEAIIWLGAALAAIAGFFTYGWTKKKQGAAAQKAKADQEDIENAEDIRRRVERDLADELRKHDGRGYRD